MVDYNWLLLSRFPPCTVLNGVPGVTDRDDRVHRAQRVEVAATLRTRGWSRWRIADLLNVTPRTVSRYWRISESNR